MSFYIRNGNRITIADDNAINVTEKLPAHNYIVSVDPFGGYYLEIVDNFVNPDKLYGSVSRDTERFIRTYKDRPQSTGIMLSGEKGSGKTLLARNLGIECQKIGIPCIIINAPHSGDTLILKRKAKDDNYFFRFADF
jgi:SpoVK/Ycf46/Vps4 family AAA+-type ATPase